jgi:hypothetical protein
MTKVQGLNLEAATKAQARADHDGCAYVVLPAGANAPLAERVADLPSLGLMIVALVTAGRALLVTPRGAFAGQSAEEIVGNELALLA